MLLARRATGRATTVGGHEVLDGAGELDLELLQQFAGRTGLDNVHELIEAGLEKSIGGEIESSNGML